MCHYISQLIGLLRIIITILINILINMMIMQLLNASSEHNGHIPRNVRLSLMSIDMVQPYVCIKHVALSRRPGASSRRDGTWIALNEGAEAAARNATDCGQTGIATTQLERDACGPASSSTRSNGSSHDKPHLLSESPPAAVVAAVMPAIKVMWYVGGSSTVDCTFLSWHVPGDTPSTAPNTTIDWTAYLDSLHSQYPHATEAFGAFCSRNYSKHEGPLDLTFPVLASPSPHRGAGRWGNNATILSSDSSAPIDNPSHVFTSSPVLPIYNSKLFPPGRYWLVAWAMTDQHYGVPHQGYPVDRRPQSHLANVRTNVRWYKQVNSRVARGTLFWPSDPIEVVVSEGGYEVWSVTADCAWWDRTHHPSSDDTQTPPVLHEASPSSTDPVSKPIVSSTPPYYRYVFHHPISMQDWTGAFKVLTGALLLIVLLVCCAMRVGKLSQWRHKNRFFSSIVNYWLFSYVRFSRFPSKPVSK